METAFLLMHIIILSNKTLFWEAPFHTGKVNFFQTMYDEQVTDRCV
uniref:Uncharacterized protein n=1 Tax=Arundo donax TaxID=35708 RepID=A0A0A8Z412_ARUDO